MMKISNLYFNLKYTDTSWLPRWYRSKEPAYQCRRWERHGFDPWIGKSPWKRAWQSTPVTTHSNSLAWEIPWTEESGGLQSTGSQRGGHN